MLRSKEISAFSALMTTKASGDTGVFLLHFSGTYSKMTMVPALRAGAEKGRFAIRQITEAPQSSKLRQERDKDFEEIPIGFRRNPDKRRGLPRTKCGGRDM